jgi:hypothetical protein
MIRNHAEARSPFVRFLTLTRDSMSAWMFRRRLRRLIADTAASEALPMSPAAKRELWQRLALSQGQQQIKSQMTRLIFDVRFAMVGIAAMATLIVVSSGSLDLLFDRSYQTQEEGIKSGGGKPLARLKSLKFAVVKEGSAIVSGYEGMEVAIGSSIIFSVESEGIGLSDPGKYDLYFSHLSKEKQKYVADYQLSSDKEVLKDEGQYIAFPLEHTGSYHFSFEPSGENVGEHAQVAFQVQVVD